MPPPNFPPLVCLFVACLNILFYTVQCEPESDLVAYATKCEACLLAAIEIELAFEKSGKTTQVIETASGKRVPYRRSEARFYDTIESVCARFLRYTVHKEFTGTGVVESEKLKRFAPGRSETMRTLHGLVQKGVNVELGMPYEMWDNPSVEIAQLKADCESILEQYEDDLETFYWAQLEAENQDSPKSGDLRQFLCVDRFLASTVDTDRYCLQQYNVMKRHILEMQRKIEQTDPRSEL